MSLTAILAILIAAGEWTGLARALTGGPWVAGALDGILLVLFAIAIIRARRAGWVRPTVLDVAMVAFFGLALVQILNPNVPGLVVGLEGFRKTAYTMLAYGVVRLSGNDDPRRFFGLVALASLPALLWAIRQAVMPLAIDLRIVETSGVSPIGFRAEDVLRAFSPTAGPFHLGVVAGSVVIIATVLAAARSRWYAVPALVAAVALGASLTRANIAATVVALVGILVLWAPAETRRRVLATGGAAIAALLVSAVLAAGNPTGSVPSPSDGATGAPGPSPTASAEPEEFDPLDERNLVFRFQYWQRFVDAIAERPVFGYGTSAAADGFDADYAGTGSQRFSPHSIYFKPALESGIPGFVLFILLGLLIVRVGLRALAVDRPVALIGLGIVVLLAVSGLAGPMLDAYPFNALFWATAGWLAVLDARSAAIARVAPPTA